MSFVLLMGVVFSFSSVTESNSKLSTLKSEIATVEAESSKLRLALAEKNDLNVIEELAIHEYNMVKEGSVHVEDIQDSVEKTLEHAGFTEAAKSDASAPLMQNVQKVYAGMTYGRSTLNENLMNDNNRGFLA